MTPSIASHPALVTGACSLVSVRAIQQGIKAVKRFLGCGSGITAGTAIYYL